MKVYLMGELGSKFGEEWDMSVPRIKDIFNLIGCQRKGFREYITDLTKKGVNFTIQRGEDFIGEEELQLSLSENDVIITPVPAGAGSVGKIIVGAILLATVGWALVAAGTMGGAGLLASSVIGETAFSTAIVGSQLTGVGMAVAGLGLSLVMGGIQEMLVPEPGRDQVEQESYLFGGGVNSIKEGLPVPVIYGQLEVAGKPISVNYVLTRPISSSWTYQSPNNIKTILEVANRNSNFAPAP